MKKNHLFTALLLTCLMFSTAPPLAGRASNASAAPLGWSAGNSFGYILETGLDFDSNWKEIRTDGAPVDFSGQTDDAISAPIALGFSMPFFEHSYDSVYVSTNGFLAFGDTAPRPVKHNAPIPVDDEPNNIAAPLWDDLVLTAPPYTAGKVYHQSGGDAPNRYMVIEWVGVLRFGSGNEALLTFEVVLYENGDILFNYLDLPGETGSTATVGIEDAEGVDGVQYLYNQPGLAPNTSLAFRYPFSGPRMKAFPKYLGGFFSNQSVDFSITIRNTGTVEDAYNLAALAQEGELEAEISFRDAASLAALSDSNGDGVVDTGPVAPGSDKEVVMRLIAGPGAPVGDYLFVEAAITSSVDPEQQFFVQRAAAIPAQFAHAINSAETGTNVLFSLPTNQILEQPTRTTLSTIPALVRVSRYVYLLGWERAAEGISNIEYVLLDYLSRYVSPLKTIRDNSLSTEEKWSDVSPVITNSADEQIGVLFIRKKSRLFGGSNENVIFALLDAGGNVRAERNITNNTSYGYSLDTGIDFFSYPALTTSSGNKFILSWENTRWVKVGETEKKAVVDIYMAVLDHNGNVLVSPTRLTESEVDNKHYHEPVLAATQDGGAYLVFSAYNNEIQQYQLGDIKFSSSFNEEFRGLVDGWAGCKPDVLQLKSGNILLAWSNLETNQISYNVALTDTQPYSYIHLVDLNTPTGLTADYVSVTQDPNGNGVITWGDRQKDFLFYTLVTSLGNPITPAMMFNYGVIPDAAQFFNGNMASAPLDGTVKNVIPLIGW